MRTTTMLFVSLKLANDVNRFDIKHTSVKSRYQYHGEATYNYSSCTRFRFGPQKVLCIYKNLVIITRKTSSKTEYTIPPVTRKEDSAKGD